MAQTNRSEGYGVFVWRCTPWETFNEVEKIRTDPPPDPVRAVELFDYDCPGSPCFCAFCKEQLSQHGEYRTGNSPVESGPICTVCGWARIGYDLDYAESSRCSHVLYEFPLNGKELLLEEIGAFVAENYEQIYDLEPRKFEELIANIFANHGYISELTKSTRDGGYDVMLFDKHQEKTLVEVKRYRGKVGVEIVRQLLGVQLIEGAKTAKLVTAGQFTAPAALAASSAMLRNQDYELELIDADALLNLLGVYRSQGFRLPNFDDERKLRRRIR